MKKQELMTARSIIFALTLAGTIAAPTATLRAQTYQHVTQETQAQSLEDRFGEGRLERLKEHQSQKMEGSWVVTVTPVVPPGVPKPSPFRAYATISRGGALFGSDRNRPFSKQHGTWEHTEGDEFAWTLTEDLFDGTGIFVGTLKVRATITLIGKDEFVGVSNGESRDAAGNVIFDRCGTIRGERIKIEPLARQCQSVTLPK
jgi:hypothetical protein